MRGGGQRTLDFHQPLCRGLGHLCRANRSDSLYPLHGEWGCYEWETMMTEMQAKAISINTELKHPEALPIF